jgi:hypothetical protein
MSDAKVYEFKRNSRNEEFEGILKSYREKIKKIDCTNPILVVNLSEANIFHITLRTNLINIVFDNLPEKDVSYSAVLVLKQDQIGSRRIVFPDNVLWSYNEVPVLAKRPNHADVLNLITFDGGESYYGSHALANLGK